LCFSLREKQFNRKTRVHTSTANPGHPKVFFQLQITTRVVLFLERPAAPTMAAAVEFCVSRQILWARILGVHRVLFSRIPGNWRVERCLGWGCGLAHGQIFPHFLKAF